MLLRCHGLACRAIARDSGRRRAPWGGLRAAPTARDAPPILSAAAGSDSGRRRQVPPRWNLRRPRRRRWGDILKVGPIGRETRVKIEVKTRGALRPLSLYPCLYPRLPSTFTTLSPRFAGGVALSPATAVSRSTVARPPRDAWGGRGTARPTPGACGGRTRVPQLLGHGTPLRGRGASPETSSRPGLGSPASRPPEHPETLTFWKAAAPWTPEPPVPPEA